MPDRWADKVMNIYIKQSLEDDPIFFQGLMRLVSDAIHRVNPEDVFLVRTDNYFDVKWFAFAGKVKVGINTGIPAINSKIQAVWKIGVDVTIPPFVPHRIVEQTHIKYADGSLMPAAADSRLVHPLQKKRSSQNIHNRLIDHSPSALFIWFSSKSSSNGRGSIMVYRTKKQKVCGWYASFTRGKQWHVDRARNKNRDLIEKLFQQQTEEDATQQMAPPDGRKRPGHR